jgi:extracellular factor (EF) 3-hydroxypalmitic acid methyl ester biosynthesis protein
VKKFSPADAVKYLETVVETGGPDVPDYLPVANALNIIHQHEYVIKDGLSTRAQIFQPFEDFLQRHRKIFRTTASMQGFAYAKPHGYAGDFEIIERIYNRSVSDLDDVQKWDIFFQRTPATEAVRNRAVLVNRFIEEKRPASLLSVGCGPGLDIRDAASSNPDLIRVDLLDNDEKAILRARANNAWAVDASRTVSFIVKNALRFRPAKHYDLGWCSGLFDYLDDKTFVFLLRRLKDMVGINGRLAVGNFSPDNPSRSYMETIGGWLLIHRSVADLVRLAMEVGFSSTRTRVITDQTGVNLFIVAENA